MHDFGRVPAWGFSCTLDFDFFIADITGETAAGCFET